MAKTLIHLMKLKYPNNIIVVLVLVLPILISLDTNCAFSTNESKSSSGRRITRLPLYHREKFMASHFKDERSLILARLARDRARLKHLHRQYQYSDPLTLHPNSEHNETEVFEEGGEYVTVLKVGSPPQKVQLLVDMGTPLTWWQCQPNCDYCFPTSHHIFDTSMSSTYTQTNCTDDPCDVTQIYIQGCIRRDDPACHYSVQYEDGSFSQGVMGKEVVSTADGVPLHNSFSFGCGRHNQKSATRATMFNADATGVLGLVPGRYSFPTQLQADTFTLCLPPYNTTSSGTLYMTYLGELFQHTSKAILDIWPAHYHLGFGGIEIEEEAIPIPPEFWECDAEGVGGVILDTGSTITKFPQQAYDIFKDYFLRNIDDLPRLPGEDQLDTCFDGRGVKEWTGLIPKVKFIFKLREPALELANEQLIMSVGNGKYCLAFGAGGPTTIIGSWQLQGSLIGFDIPNHMVAFRPGMLCYR